MQFDRDDCSMEHLQATHETHGALWNITPLARAQDVHLRRTVSVYSSTFLAVGLFEQCLMGSFIVTKTTKSTRQTRRYG